MALGNAKQILRNVPLGSAVKLSLLTARFSRPGLRPVWDMLLAPAIHDGEISIEYSRGGRSLRSVIRESDEDSDLHSTLEVVVREVYPLDAGFAPDVVVDGGANIGLFTLQAAAVYPKAAIVACEPLPRNLELLKRHMAMNSVQAEVLPVCLGGSRRTIPFYCREANSSSFDPGKPYDSVSEIEVLRLGDVLEGHAAERILIKLDIEGMEMETLESFVPGERRAVVVMGELHEHVRTQPVLRALLETHGWSMTMGDLSGGDAMFVARSPAAQGI
jgi:FkbM family methyltransferase